LGADPAGKAEGPQLPAGPLRIRFRLRLADYGDVERVVLGDRVARRAGDHADVVGVVSGRIGASLEGATADPGADGAAIGGVSEEVESLRRDSEQLLERAISEIDVTGVDIRPEAVQGEPVDVLVNAAREAELLVVGLGTKGALTEHVHGSIGQQCAHQVNCPVVLVHVNAD
jgi:nucleotide-binding universal stress UspA family protein